MSKAKCEVKKARAGFTLIEIVVVLCLITIIAAASARFSLPALSQFSCVQEKQAALSAIERARHLSQFNGRGNVAVESTSSGYQIHATGGGGTMAGLIDEIQHQSSAAVTMVGNIVFKEKSGDLDSGVTGATSNAEISIGDSHSLCHETITINKRGAIL